MITNYSDGRTWFDVNHIHTGQWLTNGDLFVEFLRWETPHETYHMIWFLGCSKFGLGIIGVIKSDANFALKPLEI